MPVFVRRPHPGQHSFTLLTVITLYLRNSRLFDDVTFFDDAVRHTIYLLILLVHPLLTVGYIMRLGCRMNTDFLQLLPRSALHRHT